MYHHQYIATVSLKEGYNLLFRLSGFDGSSSSQFDRLFYHLKQEGYYTHSYEKEWK